jgi:hypothetical protein
LSAVAFFILAGAAGCTLNGDRELGPIPIVLCGEHCDDHTTCADVVAAWTMFCSFFDSKRF